MEEQERSEIQRDVYVSLREYFLALRAEDQNRINERFEALNKALELQAKEYERRLHDLNGEFERDRTRQHDYVTIDKWEATNKAEATARTAALLRVDEKFEEYVKRYEVRQREVDLLLAAQSGAAEEAKRAVEDAVRKSDAQSRELARKQSRNLGLASLALGIFVFASNFLPDILK